MERKLKVLNIEDEERDVALIKRFLSQAGYEVFTERVDTEESMRDALQSREWDVILCDYSMPKFSALGALNLLRELNLDIPFIIISGTVGETVAVEAMRAGAHDYLMKDNLTRLVPAIERERNEVENRRARQQAEDRLRLQSAALEAAANAILITDSAGRIVWANPAFTENTGYSLDEVVGRNPRILKSGIQDRSFYEAMWKTILDGQVWRNTIVNRRKDGSLNHEDLTITPIRNGNGEISHFIAIKQDITELQHALSELRAKGEELAIMTQQLWQASKLATVGELAASIAHELNNPLATISLRIETLTPQLRDDEQKSRSLEIVSAEVDRMGKLVSSLLEFSRRSHQQISTLDVCDEIDQSLELIEYHLRSHGIKVTRDYAHVLPTIHADRQQLRQVFLNLLTNASDAMPGGGQLKVRVSLASHEGPGQRVQIEFVDSGNGIESDDLERMWDPFFTTKPEGKGTGLGLAICRRVIEEHRGSISIDSRPGAGATVTIILPALNGEPLSQAADAEDVEMLNA